nr:MAG TPA: hypothetical protein [Caudoviricetes sp.]
MSCFYILLNIGFSWLLPSFCINNVNICQHVKHIYLTYVSKYCSINQ